MIKETQVTTFRNVNPLLRDEAGVIPKYSIGYLYPDGRVRLEDKAIVQPNQCQKVELYH